MVIPALIEHKRDGGELTPAQWAGLIRAYVGGQVPDYQMSALLMAPRSHPGVKQTSRDRSKRVATWTARALARRTG